MFFGISILGIVSGLLSQYAYSNEKISVLAPFGEAKQLITIVLGFCLFQGKTSVFTFAMALLAGTIIVLSGLDTKTMSANRYCSALALSGLLRATASIGIAYVLAVLSPATYLITDLAITTSILGMAFVYRKMTAPNQSIAPSKPVPIFREMSINNGLWLISYVIGLTLVKNL